MRAKVGASERRTGDPTGRPDVQSVIGGIPQVMGGLLEPIDLSRRESISSEISRKILDYLLAGHVAPGGQLPPERKLAEALGVGRGVVREALKSLTLLGLIEVRQGDGTYLKRAESELLSQAIAWGLLLGTPRILDLIEARRHLEVIVAGLAAKRRDERALQDLRDHLAEMRAAMGDADRFVAADVAFHLTIAEAAGNDTLYQIMLNIRSLLQVWIARVMHAASDYHPSLDDHIPILEAIEARDVEAARAAVAAHLQRATDRLAATLAEEEFGVGLEAGPRLGGVVDSAARSE
jgi:GntR family transcriptional repressor for pyruvate dehydrogenase complex